MNESRELLLGEFAVQRMLGHGGSGDVALVQSIRTGERYAAKRLRVADLAGQQRFITEAQRWLALPEHPNVNACRFIRTVNSGLVVFSEYVEGGSLAERIASRSLYEGEQIDVMTRLVDIAVQVIWGLEAALEGGLLHLDVKPSNVLLTADGIAKITDFGMASTGDRDADRVLKLEAFLDSLVGEEGDAGDREVIKAALREQLFQQDNAAPPRAIAEGLSYAYASPEQANRQPVEPAGDVWSWAVTVLEMFVGERTWHSGALAGVVLEQALADDAITVRIPPHLAQVLADAFRRDPAERPSLDVIAAALESGSSQKRPASSPAPAAQGQYTRRLISGVEWFDSRARLMEAYELAGLDQRDAVAYWPRGSGTRRSQAMDDLRALWQARTVLSGASASERVRWARWGVRRDMGAVASSVGDLSGAASHYEEAVRELGEPTDDGERLALVDVLVGLTIALRTAGHGGEAVERSGQAVDVANLVGDHPAKDRAVATATLVHANSISDHESALALYDRAAEIYRRAGDAEGEARSLGSKASRLALMGRQAEIEPLFRQAESQLAVIADAGRADVSAVLGRLLLNQARIDPDSARRLDCARRAVRRLTELVEVKGWYELAGDLGQGHFEVGRNEGAQDRPREALAAYRRARGLLELAVQRDGRIDLADELARVFDHESTLVRDLEDPLAAVEVARQGVLIWQRLGRADGEVTWRREIASARQKLGTALSDAGDQAAAFEEYQDVLRSLGNEKTEADSVLIALSNHGLGIAQRRQGHPADAVERYRDGLDALAVQPDKHCDIRALLLNSLGAALGDLGRNRQALRTFEAAMGETERVAAAGGKRLSDVADGRQRIVNALMKLGDYETARGLAEETLSLYDDLVARGRDDLLVEAGRLRGAYGIILCRLLDLDGAIESLSRALEVFQSATTDDETKQKLSQGVNAFLMRFERLRSVVADDLPVMVAEITSTMEGAAELSRSGDAYHASTLLENVLDELRWLSNRVGTEEIIALCGHAGLQIGITAMSCGRDGVAHRGFSVSIQCHERLLQYRATGEYLNAWFNGYVGSASVYLIGGDKQAAAEIVANMDTRLTVLNPYDREEWVARARRILADLDLITERAD